MDSLLLSSLGSVFGLVGTFITPIMYMFPILIFGLILFYFTGDKKRGEGIVNNFMRVGLRIYNYIWTYISSILVFTGMYQILNYLLTQVLPEAEKSTSKYFEDDYYGSILPKTSIMEENNTRGLVLGIVFILIGLVLLFSHLGLNYYLENKIERRGTLITKLFGILSITTFSIIVFGSIIGTVLIIIDYLYDKHTGISAGPIALMLAGYAVWLPYMGYTYTLFKKEKAS